MLTIAGGIVLGVIALFAILAVGYVIFDRLHLFAGKVLDVAASAPDVALMPVGKIIPGYDAALSYFRRRTKKRAA